MMKTLVIHPDDPTNNFLREAYKDNGYTVLHDKIEDSLLREMIADHERIIMLGHGTPHGLMGWHGFAINPTHAELLRTKQCFIVWCNADRYVHAHDIKGFYTGMIISEVGEAMYVLDGEAKKNGANKENVDESNQYFVDALGEAIAEEDRKALENFQEHYRNDAKDNEVMQYNIPRLYYRDEIDPNDLMHKLIKFSPKQSKDLVYAIPIYNNHTEEKWLTVRTTLTPEHTLTGTVTKHDNDVITVEANDLDAVFEITEEEFDVEAVVIARHQFGGDYYNFMN